VVGMLTVVSESGIYPPDRAYLDQLLASLESERDIAYAMVLDARGGVLAARADGGPAPPPAAEARGPAPAGQTLGAEKGQRGRRFFDFIAPIESHGPQAATGLTGERRPVIGYVRLGWNAERQAAQLQTNLIAALLIVAALVVVAIVLTLVLTRRLVAPMRSL